jgi:hypothetical protein
MLKNNVQTIVNKLIISGVLLIQSSVFSQKYSDISDSANGSNKIESSSLFTGVVGGVFKVLSVGIILFFLIYLFQKISKIFKVDRQEYDASEKMSDVWKEIRKVIFIVFLWFVAGFLIQIVV